MSRTAVARTDEDAWRELDRKLQIKAISKLVVRRETGIEFMETPFQRALHLAQSVLWTAAQAKRKPR
jgi:hypothetical protein